MTRENRAYHHRMHSAQAESCFLRTITASTLAEILCALSLMIVNLIIVSILGIIIL